MKKEKTDALELLMGEEYVKEQQEKGVIPKKKHFRGSRIVVTKPIIILESSYDEDGYYIKYLDLKI